MNIYTIQISKHRLLNNTDIEFIDTTVKSSDSFLKPTWEIVMGVKKGEISEAEYTEKYLEIIRERYKNNKSQFINFLQNNNHVALACYCKPHVFCHRILAIDILSKIAKKENIEFNYLGEIENKEFMKGNE